MADDPLEQPLDPKFELPDQSPDHPSETAEEDALPPDPEMLRFLDLPIRVRIELDRKRITLGEALELTENSIISLERSAGDNVDLLLNGVPIGSGEIVVIEDTMGLRLTDLRRESVEEGS